MRIWDSDWFPRQGLKTQASWGFQGHAPLENFLDFSSLKSPFPGFLSAVRQYWKSYVSIAWELEKKIVQPFSKIQLEKYFVINLTKYQSDVLIDYKSAQ